MKLILALLCFLVFFGCSLGEREIIEEDIKASIEEEDEQERRKRGQLGRSPRLTKDGDVIVAAK